MALEFGQSSASFGVNTQDDIDDTVRPMLAESRYVIENKPVMSQPGMVRVVTLGKGDGASFREPKYGTFRAYDLADGVDMNQAQKLSDSIWTVTPGEIGCQVMVTKKTLRIVRDDILRVIGRLMGDAMTRKLDKDGIAMFSGASIGFGSAGTGLTQAYIMAAVNAIEGEEEPGSPPVNGVFHSHQLHPLAKTIAVAGTYPIPDGVSEEVYKNNFKFKTLAGCNLYTDNNIEKDASDDAIGAVFAREALLLVKVAMGMEGIEKEYDSSWRAWEINQVWEYGWGEYYDKWIRSMTFDAATPTS